MAIDSYMAFQQYAGGAWLDSESQIDFSHQTDPLMDTPSKLAQGKIFEIEDFSFDIEQTLNIGGSASGAGAGKVTFNPFSITRKIDRASPLLFQMACSGTAFETVVLALANSAGAATTGGVNPAAGQIFLRFDFRLVAVKTISWSYDSGSPKEVVTFEYGGLQVRYSQQNPNGTLSAPIQGGWNRVRNVQDLSSGPLLTA
jgi:type VI secretion system secreted protein Hcp